MPQRFLIHPSDLRRRQIRCQRIVDSFASRANRFRAQCEVCGAGEHAVLADRDRYGFPVRTAICYGCGLIYVVDRFSAADQDDLYASGTYRALISGFKNRQQTVGEILRAQLNYATSLSSVLSGYLGTTVGGRLLDVGGSTGRVAAAFVEKYGYRATLIDPAPAEVAMARKLGIESAVSSVEDWETDDRFDLILLCRSVEHLFDLPRAMSRIRQLLKPGGLFYCDIAEFLEICRREGPPAATTKVDHCYWLTQETAPGIFARLGFEVIGRNMSLPPDQVGFLLRPASQPAYHAVGREWIEQRVRMLRETSSVWNEYGASALNPGDWLRQRAYRVKRLVQSRTGGMARAAHSEVRS